MGLATIFTQKERGKIKQGPYRISLLTIHQNSVQCGPEYTCKAKCQSNKSKEDDFQKSWQRKESFHPRECSTTNFYKKKVKQTDQQWQEYVHEYCLGNDVQGKSRPGGLQPGARLPVKPGQH